MNIEDFKAKVEAKCSIMDKKLYDFDESLHGKGVRDRILALTSWLPRYSELFDQAKLMSSLQKRKIEKSETLAMVILCGPAGDNIPATLKKYHIDTCEIELDGEKTTPIEEKKKLEYFAYAVNRFGSMVDAIKVTIFSYQSALNFDRDEMKQLSYTS